MLMRTRNVGIALALVLAIVTAPPTGTATAVSGDSAVTSIKVTPVSAGESIFESSEHRCQSAASAAWGYRQEPALAVNPQDPHNIVAMWRQDQWGGATLEGEGGGALSDVVAYSTNGGVSWTEVALPELGMCNGGGANGASDPTVSFGPDGTAYVSAIQFDEGSPVQGIVVYRSTNGGRSWDGPYTAQIPDGANDRPTIVADPHTPGLVYLVWLRLGLTGDCGCLELAFARSTDGGRTWSRPTAANRFLDGHGSVPAQLSVLPDGALVVLFSELETTTTARMRGTYPASIHAARSEDGGQTWTRHKVADYTVTDHSGQDPDTSYTIDAAEFFIEQAADREGRLYAVWHHNTSISLGEVFAARSDDGGSTWTKPLTVARVPAQVLDPTIAVADDGTVAVTWADLRNDDDVPDEPDDEELTTDWWIATSADGGETWGESHLSGPFDLRNAQFVRGMEERDRQQPHYWLGDYYGLRPMPGGFGAVFIEAREPRVFGTDDEWITQTDVMFARIRLQGPHG